MLLGQPGGFPVGIPKSCLQFLQQSPLFGQFLELPGQAAEFFQQVRNLLPLGG